MEGLQKANGRKHYSKELKLSAVQDHLSGNYSMIELLEETLKVKIRKSKLFKSQQQP